nr:RNB domain-containing ribonuclease [Cellulomonas sp. APG4]
MRANDDVVRAGLARIRAEHEVPVEFSGAALEEAATAATAAPSRERRDLTGLPFVTLDPPGSTDLDQAMHLERRGSGFRVRYAIADVGAFVRPGGALDAAAHARVQTVYCPDTRVPLHPPVLSEGAASLRPGADRPAVVWELDLDATGERTAVRVERGVVRSVARLDYGTEQARLDAGLDTDEPMSLLAEIGSLRARLERERGGVSLGRPEQEVVQHEDGGWELAYRATLPLEDHNAQISLLTGMAAAELMVGARVGVLRTMPAADERDVRRLRRQALALGVAWPVGRDYGDVLTDVDHTSPGGAAFLAAATTLFRGAAWTPFTGDPPAPAEHGAIAAPYAHVTAPLRRLVDRYGLEICLAACAGRAVPGWVLEALDDLGGTMADGARRASAVDRASTDLVEAAVLQHRVGEEFDGVALDERTVQLAEPAVVARTEGDPLPEGERVRLRLVTADVVERRVAFRQVADGGASPSRPAPSRP